MGMSDSDLISLDDCRITEVVHIDSDSLRLCKPNCTELLLLDYEVSPGVRHRLYPHMQDSSLIAASKVVTHLAKCADTLFGQLVSLKSTFGMVFTFIPNIPAVALASAEQQCSTEKQYVPICNLWQVWHYEALISC